MPFGLVGAQCDRGRRGFGADCKFGRRPLDRRDIFNPDIRVRLLPLARISANCAVQKQIFLAEKQDLRQVQENFHSRDILRYIQIPTILKKL